MICPNCKTEIQNYSNVCPFCGINLSQVNQNQNYQQQNFQNNNSNDMFGNFNAQNNNYASQNPTYYQQQTQPVQKKKNGCLIAIIIFLIIGALILGGLVLGGTLLFKIGKDAIENMPVEQLVVDVENAYVEENINDVVEIETPEETLEEVPENKYQFKDSDGDGVLDGDIFD